MLGTVIPTFKLTISGKDPGFTMGGGGGATSRGAGRQPIILARFRQKLHENEENYTEREGTSKIVLCRSATVSGLNKRGVKVTVCSVV